jgi:hypothetical protein
MSNKYIYSVNPRRVISGLSDGTEIRVNKSLELSKEDVLLCLQKASVYRRFNTVTGAGNDIVRVTTGNLDRLHNEKYMTEEEYEKFLAANASKDHGKVVNREPVQEKKPEPVKEVKTPVVETEVVPEKPEEAPVQEAENATAKFENNSDNTTDDRKNNIKVSVNQNYNKKEKHNHNNNRH